MQRGAGTSRVGWVLAACLVLAWWGRPTVAAGVPRALLERVVVIGASASDGWNVEFEVRSKDVRLSRPVTFREVLRAALPDEGVEVVEHADFLFFRNPHHFGPAMVDAARAEQPSLVVAVDFLFWYAYGTVGPDGGRLASEEDRMKLLERGLAELDRLQVPLVVGDLPDMSGALEARVRMLGAAQVPRPETLATLNARLRAWAADRPRVAVLSLSGLMAGADATGDRRVGAHTWPVEAAADFLQADDLHPTSDGLIAIAQLVEATMVEATDRWRDLGAATGPLVTMRTDRDAIRAVLTDQVLATAHGAGRVAAP